MVGLALKDGGDDRILRAIRTESRDKGSYGPFTDCHLHRGGYAQHIALLVHPLEDGGGFSDQFGHFIDNRRLDGQIPILANPLFPDKKLR